MSKTPFIKTLFLTPEEKELIQEVCTLELEAVMEGIIDSENRIDVMVYENLNELPQDSIIPETWKIIYAFDWVKNNPSNLHLLGEDYLSIFKHIMFSFFIEPEYQTTLRSVARKLLVIDRNLDTTTNLLFQN